MDFISDDDYFDQLAETFLMKRKENFIIGADSSQKIEIGEECSICYDNSSIPALTKSIEDEYSSIPSSFKKSLYQDIDIDGINSLYDTLTLEEGKPYDSEEIGNNSAEEDDDQDEDEDENQDSCLNEASNEEIWYADTFDRSNSCSTIPIKLKSKSKFENKTNQYRYK
jgi:hypothetical protein